VAETVNVNGAKIPTIGFGTWELRGEICAQMVAAALALGYRHIDTAVGEGIRSSGVPREEIFITTKVRPEWGTDGVLQRSVEESLTRLGTRFVDLLLIHWPNPAIPIPETMRALADAHARGLTRHIGVSNFTIANLAQALATSPAPLTAAQIEYHPYLDQARLLAALRHHGLAIIAYSPIALGKVAHDPRLVAIGKGHNKSAVQVTLRWLIQRGDVVAIPRSSKPERMRENFDVFDFRLTNTEMDQISHMTVPNARLVNEPQWVPHWD
jgi:diketogulonate reductase-like aldo/keto reductase